MSFRLFYLLCLSFVLFGCTSHENNFQNENFSKITLKYAKSFTLSESQSAYKLTLINEENQSEIAHYIFEKQPQSNHRTAIFSSSAVGYLAVLNQLETVIGVEKRNNIYNPILVKKRTENHLKEYFDYALVNPEKLANDGVNTIFYSLFSTDLNPLDKKLNQLKITAIPLLEWKEQHPLGKAEWLKVYGIVYGCYDQAVKAFDEIATEYDETKDFILYINQWVAPKVLANTLFQDVWYLPSGNSYTAQIFRDAGGHYPLKSSGTGSDSFTFEQIYKEYQDADKWVNVGFGTKKEMLAMYDGYRHFKAFQTNQMYSFFGNSIKYFEESPVKPHLVLKDLRFIFASDNPQNLYFYSRVE
ncbi:MAG TPA: ABC transporter substrate-binding protein [Crocinitomicaceae bacterium]|nr:ABC transporter substrate-binding protein [Crocinitomicaceae bacterium]